jgi:hypothetical protein
MTNPELADEAIWIIRWYKSNRKSGIEVALILLIQMPAISGPYSPPTSRIDFDTT